MKRILINIIFLFISFVCIGQYQYNQRKPYVPDPTQIQIINVTTNAVVNGWGLHGQACAGCASFYYAIMRSQIQYIAEDGNYYFYYYILFNTNSYYSNGTIATTYLEDITFSENNIPLYKEQYILVIPNETYYGWIRTTNPTSNISFYIKNYQVQ